MPGQNRVKRTWKTREVQLSSGDNGDFSIASKGALGRFWDKFYKIFFKNVTPAKRILLWYTFFSITGALLLWTPWAQKDGAAPIAFIDAMFMSSSAFSDTGLGTVVLVEQFNEFGQAVLFVQVLVGGIGWFTIKMFILSFIIRKGLSWRSRRSLSAENGASMKVALGTAKVAAVTTISMIIVFGIILGLMFYYIEPTVYNGYAETINGNMGQSMWTGFFMANSAINNAGLDILGGNSLAPLYFNHGFQWIMLFLFVLGGMGFGILYDVKEWMIHKHRGVKFRFSLLTKVSTITYLSVASVGVGLAFMFEFISMNQQGVQSFLGAEFSGNLGGSNGIVNPYTDINYGSLGDRYMAIFFNTMSTRNAGFSTIDLNLLSTGTITTYNTMMFIGSGPGSTAGGIRTTTLFVMVIAIFQFIRGKRDAEAFKRRIPRSDVRQAFVLTIVSIGLILITTTVIVAAENGNAIHAKYTYIPQGVTPFASQGSIIDLGNGWYQTVGDATFVDHLFTVFSAYGTTGLATVSLTGLTVTSKTSLIILMFIGQLGVLNMLKTFVNTEKRQAQDKGRMITETIAIG